MQRSSHESGFDIANMVDSRAFRDQCCALRPVPVRLEYRINTIITLLYDLLYAILYKYFDRIRVFKVASVEETHEQLEAIYGARAEAYGGIPDVTQTLIGVAGLLLPGLKLEIKCIAHL